jgi:Tfp pilus assembly protein PilO
MNPWISLIFEILLFLVLGFLFYLYQRRKVFRYYRQWRHDFVSHALTLIQNEKLNLQTFEQELCEFQENLKYNIPIIVIDQAINQLPQKSELRELLEDHWKELTGSDSPS